MKKSICSYRHFFKILKPSWDVTGRMQERLSARGGGERKRERETERDRDRDGEKDREREEKKKENKIQ